MAPARVSVLLPVYGDEPFLAAALSSLADQTYADFTVVAVTESLSARTDDALADAAVPVRRVAYDGDGGLSGALNAGLDAAGGEYVARMDADDVAHPERLARQVAFMDANPRVGVVGSGYERIDAAGRRLGPVVPPTTHLEIRWQLLFTSCLPHPTAMLRRSVLDSTGVRYRPAFDAAEDFDLWTRLAPDTRLRNLPDPLLRYRVDGGKKSTRDADRQAAAVERIVRREAGRTLSTVRLPERDLLDIVALLYDGESVDAPVRSVTGNYLRLLDAFERELADGERLHGVRTHAAVTVARSVLRPPVERRDLALLGTLLGIAPNYPLDLARFLYRHRIASATA